MPFHSPFPRGDKIGRKKKTNFNHKKKTFLKNPLLYSTGVETTPFFITDKFLRASVTQGSTVLHLNTKILSVEAFKLETCAKPTHHVMSSYR